MRVKFALLAIVGTVATLAFAPTASAQTGVIEETLNTVCTVDGQTGTFTGTLRITPRFVVQNGQLGLVGTLSGVCRNAAGEVLRTVTNQQVFIPVDLAAQQSCKILDLTLGPIHLDLLGLVVDVSQIDIDITAQPGPGNLLGNLLCQVARLLDQDLVSQVARILNRLLGRGLIIIG